jgi:HTH-type transcriptional regulator/antitoxin HigA
MPSRLSPIRTRSIAPATPKYLALVRKFPLRPIRSEEENEAALAVLGSLGERRREGALSPGEQDYIAVLAKLIEEYENSRYPRGPVTGSAMLAHLIEARGISQAQLATDTGIPESTVSGLVRGSRPLGRKRIEVLARYFNVDAALFQDG